MTRTRIKICGITREQDAASAVRHGADAIGLVFYPQSPRYVAIDHAARLASGMPAFVAVVALFVNPDAGHVQQVIARVRPQYLQFHGDEPPAFCSAFNLPFIKAVRMKPDIDLLQYARDYRDACGLLLDADAAGYGGGGATFDWELVPANLQMPAILSGGLNPGNVESAVRKVVPWAVDVSSGVEVAKGIKDDAKIEAFCSGVRNANV